MRTPALRPVAARVLVLMVLSPLSTLVIADSNFSPYVDANGQIGLPEAFRSSMVHLASWFVPEGDASGFHEVYTERESLLFYRQTGRFPGKPNWGDNWGWALFMPDAPARNASTDYKIDCLGRHVPARDTDWVYVEAYPTLNAD